LEKRKGGLRRHWSRSRHPFEKKKKGGGGKKKTLGRAVDSQDHGMKRTKGGGAPAVGRLQEVHDEKKKKKKKHPRIKERKGGSMSVNSTGA